MNESILMKLSFIDFLVSQFNEGFTINKKAFAKAIVATEEPVFRIQWAMRVQEFMSKLKTTLLLLPFPSETEYFARQDMPSAQWQARAKIALFSDHELTEVLEAYENINK